MKVGLNIKRSAAVFGVIFVALLSQNAEAQQGVKKRLFRADLPEVQQQEQNQREALLATDPIRAESAEVIAPNVSFDQERNRVTAKGGVLVSRGGVTAQAEEASIDMEANEAELFGDVVVVQGQGSVRASSALMQLDYETGIFNDARFTFDAGQIDCQAGETYKYGESKYYLSNLGLTTCGCRDGVVPWRFTSDEAYLEDEGYAHLYDVTLNLYDVPVFYTPYFAFPVKRDRASGLMPPTYGVSNQDGFRYRQPLYLVTSDTSDVLLTPFVDTNSRVGSFLQYRQLFSRSHSVRTKMVYSNETWRGNNTRGLVTDVGVPPQIDTNRFGLFHSQVWQGTQANSTGAAPSEFPTSFLADVHYVSDDNILRELPDQDIGLATAPFTSSYAAIRQGLGPSLAAEVGGEYNQVIDGNQAGTDDTVFQRLPEASVTGLQSFRPFGSNPFGLKVVTKGGATATQFSREEGYDGGRVNLGPTVQIPFRYQNYFSSQLELRGFNTYYNVNNPNASTDPNSTDPDGSESRQTFIGSYGISTAVERVYANDPDGILGAFSSLGAANHNNLLLRTKHVVEPFVRYNYAPDVDQDNLPLFDSLDRVRQRSVITYGISTGLLGRFSPRVPTAYPLPEFAPEPGDLPQLGVDETFPSLEFAPPRPKGGAGVRRNGEIRRLLDLSVKQSYDVVEADRDLDPLREPLSDLNVLFSLTPTNSFGFDFDTNYGTETSQFSSWSGGLRVVDDRDDYLRLRYTYIDPSVNSDPNNAGQPRISNIEAALEGVLTDRWRLAYYSRFDQTASDMLEQAVALRLVSACDCWFIDFGVSEQINPQNQQVNVRFNFSGLGGVTQDILRRNPQAPR